MTGDYDWTPHLQEGEEVLWQGRPDGRFVTFCWQELTYAFAFAWAAFLHYGLGFEGQFFSAETGLGPGAFFMALIVAIFLWNRFYSDPRLRKNERYAITGFRVLIIDCGRASLKYSARLTHMRNVFLSGRFFPILVFTPSSKFIWRCRTLGFLDGPPLSLTQFFNSDVIFRLPTNGDTALRVAVAAKQDLEKQ
ncbi:hypothetical protein KUL25_13450 [Rhodobacteraceae bacterium N5(2021)]|uniref:Uncharacterized protein n=1 Tax=Gymnodinialimonas phycosphaerae TaxID=2841589 RepID=A0A975TSL7_9RHOB|nr:hypothetical protein [Gymnodinialimonas phycosphaerae]MBY4893770.1 hypothetical protein [Gymnodinialimonas phycosphaerae]